MAPPSSGYKSQRSVLQLLVTANVVLSSLTLFTEKGDTFLRNEVS
jgi:hypothetical protein